ncbi:MAG: trimethylamine methyltransferase family protein [Acidimicrobiales bacterium]|nr:trimethylamine methyltransferase family protein [Acidimicrobiia bacterium]NNC80338.1 trimethylamine methyltransferase family protein [Acidimicrobiales bacterium]RZV48759.1 MAG: methyltransferase [Acidimicrobiales bacterium]
MARRGRARSTANEPAIRQLPWRQVEHTHGTLPVLDDEGVETIHNASLRVLEELGIELWSEDARQLFADAGAVVEGEVVRVGREVIEAALASAPSSFTLTSRNEDKQLDIGGNRMAFGLVAGPPSVHDCVGGRRPSNMEDYENFIRLAHYFNAIHIIGNQVASPLELPANNRHLDAYRANLTLSDLSFHCLSIGRGRALDGIEMMAIARGLTLEEMALSPGVTTIINVNSPRRFDEEMANGLMTMSEHGQVVSVTPFTLMGAMTPVTLAAALTQQNAEALFGIALTQLTNPGSPVMYGAFTSNVDMRSGAPAFGTPEQTKANIASGQLARRYGLPYRCSNSSASNVVDAQAAYETQMSLWGAVLGGANLVYHAAGWMEGGLQASYEKLVLDVEMLQQMMEFLTPVKLDEEELAFDAMSRVPTGGHFFGDEHTLARYEHAFYAPILSDWQNHGAWEEAGSLTATQRATTLWQTALADYEEPTMPADRREALDDYVARRKEEIADGEP